MNKWISRIATDLKLLVSYGKKEEVLDYIKEHLEPYAELEKEVGTGLGTILEALKQEEVFVRNAYGEIVKQHFAIERRFGNYLICDKEWLIHLKDYKSKENFGWALKEEDLK